MSTYLVKAQGRYIGECSLFASEQKTARRFVTKAAAFAEGLRQRDLGHGERELVRLLPKRYVVKNDNEYADGDRHWVKSQRAAFVFTDNKTWARVYASAFAGARVVRVRRKGK